MDILSVITGKSEAVLLTLDDLWNEAERLGSVSVGKTWSTDHVYTAEILFYTKSGSRVTASAKDGDVRLALKKTIEEALRLGAGL